MHFKTPWAYLHGRCAEHTVFGIANAKAMLCGLHALNAILERSGLQIFSRAMLDDMAVALQRNEEDILEEGPPDCRAQVDGWYHADVIERAFQRRGLQMSRVLQVTTGHIFIVCDGAHYWAVIQDRQGNWNRHDNQQPQPTHNASTTTPLQDAFESQHSVSPSGRLNWMGSC